MLQRANNNNNKNLLGFNFKNLLVELLSKRIVNDDKLDIIIFGASGQIGRYTVLEAVDVLTKFNWGIAGRNLKLLENVLKETSDKTNTDITDKATFIADVNNKNTLNKLVEKCQVLVNCCGPYHLYGEQIVRACIAAGTHYVDFCNEPHFMEMLQLKYHEEASLQNVYVISGCGLQSLPIDIGVNYMKEEFDGTINQIDVYMHYYTSETNMIWPLAGYGSWKSLILSCAHFRQIPSIRKRLHRKEFPALKPKSRYKAILHNSNIVPCYCIPFPFFDQQVIERSQYYFYDKEQKRPIQIHSYLAFPSYYMALIFCIWFFAIAILAQFEYCCDLLLKHPKICSFGMFSPDGPNNQSMEHIFLKYTLHAIGWGRETKRIYISITSSTNSIVKKTDKELTAVVTGINPIYGVSCCCVLASAITILKEKDKLNASFGVLTPAVAFEKTNLIGELEKYWHGLSFEIKT